MQHRLHSSSSSTLYTHSKSILYTAVAAASFVQQKQHPLHSSSILCTSSATDVAASGTATELVFALQNVAKPAAKVGPMIHKAIAICAVVDGAFTYARERGFQTWQAPMKLFPPNSCDG